MICEKKKLKSEVKLNRGSGEWWHLWWKHKAEPGSNTERLLEAPAGTGLCEVKGPRVFVCSVKTDVSRFVLVTPRVCDADMKPKPERRIDVKLWTCRHVVHVCAPTYQHALWPLVLFILSRGFASFNSTLLENDNELPVEQITASLPNLRALCCWVYNICISGRDPLKQSTVPLWG